MQETGIGQIEHRHARLARANRWLGFACSALVLLLLAGAASKATRNGEAAAAQRSVPLTGSVKHIAAERSGERQEAEVIPVIRKGNQKDRYVGRGWAPWGFFERESAKRGVFDKEYARDKIRRFITKYGENVVRFNSWRTPWGDSGVSFHVYQEPYAGLSKELLALLKEEGVTAIVSCSAFDRPSRFEKVGGVKDVVTAFQYQRVVSALMSMNEQNRENAEKHATGGISAFAPWIPAVYEDLMKAVRKMREISPPGTIGELFNERPAAWEFSPFIEAEVRIMAGIFPSVAEAFGMSERPAVRLTNQTAEARIMQVAKSGYARMFKQFNHIWGGKTIQDQVYLCPFIDPDAWGYSAHPYPFNAHAENVRMDKEWIKRLKDADGNSDVVDCIGEIGVSNTIPYWDTTRDVMERGKWKLTTGSPGRKWYVGDKGRVLEDVVDAALDHIQVSTGRPPKLLIGWTGHNGRHGMDPRVWERDTHQAMVREWERKTSREYDIGYANLYLDPELWEVWKMIVKDFWERGNASSTVYLPDDAPPP
ncbi:MAG: hypothetical protein IH851_03970 [Armatimonadetes bacterium]|nr:hypothetical protein [Armatimonadota bacterium]